MKSFSRLATFVALLVAPSVASAKDRPNIDAYGSAPARAAASAYRVDLASGAFVASRDTQSGLPTFVWSTTREVPEGASSRMTAEQAARVHLLRHASAYGLTGGALRTTRLASLHDLGRGGIVVVLRQVHDGVEVLHSDVKVLMDRRFGLVAIGGHLPQDGAKSRRFVLDEQEAVARALGDWAHAPVLGGDLLSTPAPPSSPRERRFFDVRPRSALVSSLGLRLDRPALAFRAFYAMPDALVPAYYVEVWASDAGSRGDAFAYVIAADDGRILSRENLVHSDGFTYRVFADAKGRPMDGPLLDFSPHPTGFPDGSYPGFAASTLVTTNGFNTNVNATFDPWLAAGAQTTSGNNVDAYTDDDAPDGFSGGSDIRATTTSPGVFDRAYALDASPVASDSQRQAATTQIFYTTNWLHDWWYDSGFDEAAGNAQADNYGRGGVAGDPLHAEAQDGATFMRNNADMASGVDGQPPRMQMFLWDPRPGGALLDGTIDDTIVAHEWGHYFHLRQVACGNFQCAAQSEGWGDFSALMLMIRESNTPGATYAVGQYATGAFGDPGYFGIRRYPYSTDHTKAPLTFQHIQSGVPLPDGAPIGVFGYGVDNAEPHNAGEVWADALFEAYAALLDRTKGPKPAYAFEEARRRMGDYTQASFKLAPTNPTFTEQRDALLAAAFAADPEDYAALAFGFAMRGLGSCAVSPDRISINLIGAVEAFAVAPRLEITSAKLDDALVSCDGDGVLDAGERGKLTVEIANGSAATKTPTTVKVSSDDPGISFVGGNVVTLPALAAFSKTKVSVDVRLDPKVTEPHAFAFHLEAANDSACVTNVGFDAIRHTNVDVAKTTVTHDDVEAPDTTWALAGDSAALVWSRSEPVLGNHAWLGIDKGSPSDTALVSPALEVSEGDSFVVNLSHRYAFEASDGVFWDGGVIELSTDDGASWADVSTLVQPGYGGTIGDPKNQAKNVLKDRPGFVASNAAWPAFEPLTLDFGKALAGKKVRLRFRIGTDDASGVFGWELDDLTFSGITNTPFDALIADAAECAAPTADAGPDQQVTSGDEVTLDGTKSTDPYPLPLAFAWVQKSGPDVALNGATSATPTFVAPDVSASTTLTFVLDVDDGQHGASDTVDVVVTPRVEPPQTSASASSSSGGDVMPRVDTGCGCRVGEGDEPRAVGPGLGLALLVLARRRRGKRP